MNGRYWTLLLLFPFSALAEVVSCGPTPNHLEYEVTTSQLEFTLQHPFQVLGGSLGRITGAVSVNPENLREGVAFKIAAPLKQFESQNAPVTRFIAAGREMDKDGPGFEYISLAAHMAPDLKSVGRQFSMRLLGELRFHGKARPLEVPLDCTVDSSFWKCQTFFQFKMSDLGLPPPMLLKIKARDQVSVKGEVTFGPKKGAS